MNPKYGKGLRIGRSIGVPLGPFIAYQAAGLLWGLIAFAICVAALLAMPETRNAMRDIIEYRIALILVFLSSVAFVVLNHYFPNATVPLALSWGLLLLVCAVGGLRFIFDEDAPIIRPPG